MFEEGSDGDGLPPHFDVTVRGAEVGPLLKGDWSAEKVLPKVLAVVKAMKAAGVAKIGVVGFCYGAWVGMHLAKEVELVGCAGPHPSIHVEGMFGRDPAELAKGSTCPWALFPTGDPAAGGDSDMYDAQGGVFRALEEKFPGQNVTKRFEAMPHGFVTRGAIREGQFRAGTGADTQAAVTECVSDICEFFGKRGLFGTSASLPCCPSGAVGYLAAEHAEEGSIHSVDGVSVYQVGSGANGMLFLPDVWGWNSGRTRALADDFARKGLRVWVPKVLQPMFEEGSDGDGLPPHFDVTVRGAEVGPLLKGDWSQEKVLPKLLAVVKAMKAAGVAKLGLVGFCYGAWVGMHLAREVELVGCAGPHPSIHIEGMFGRDPAVLAKGSTCPWALFPTGDPAAGGDSDMYDAEGGVFRALEEKFPGQNMTKRFKAMPHGFVTRGAIREGQFRAGSGEDTQAAVTECVSDICDFCEKRGLIKRQVQETVKGGFLSSCFPRISRASRCC